MAAPTYFDSASTPADNGSQADGATVAVTPPASMAAGDLVIFVAVVAVATPSSTPAISATGGQNWSGNIVNSSGANDLCYAVFWCQFNGSWTVNPSIVFASESGTQPCSAIMHVFRPATAGIWALNAASPSVAEASASPVVISTFPENAPLFADGVVLAVWGISATAVTWGTLTGSGWAVTGTAQYRNTAGGDLSVSFAHNLTSTPTQPADTSKVPSTAGAGISWVNTWYILGNSWQASIERPYPYRNEIVNY